MLLTLASSWIEAEIATRLSLQCTLLICHTLYMQYISLYLFNYGINCPLIGKNLILIPLKLESPSQRFEKILYMKNCLF
jgi:hypothetical protein